MDTLFSDLENTTRRAHAPLAVRMRPRVLDDLIGQDEAVGEGTWLRFLRLFSMVLQVLVKLHLLMLSPRVPMLILLKFQQLEALFLIYVVKSMKQISALLI